MHLIEENEQPKYPQVVEDMLAQIQAKELEVLTKTLERYCAVKNINMDWSKVFRITDNATPNKFEYWIALGHSEGNDFVMGRELIIEYGIPKLNCVFPSFFVD